jgi:hypothetical protein
MNAAKLGMPIYHVKGLIFFKKDLQNLISFLRYLILKILDNPGNLRGRFAKILGNLGLFIYLLVIFA